MATEFSLPEFWILASPSGFEELCEAHTNDVGRG